MTAAQQPDYIRKIDEYEKQMIEDLKSLAKLESCAGAPADGAPFGEGPLQALNAMLAGLTAERITLPIIMELEARMGAESGMVGAVIKVVYDLLNELDAGEVQVTGIDHLLQYPEYSDTAQFRELLGALEKKDDILDLVSAQDGEKDVNVLIGSESRVKVMNNSALVFKPIVKDGQTLGAIGVLGPRRMDYAKVLATLEGLSGNIETLIGPNKPLNNGGKSDG